MNREELDKAIVAIAEHYRAKMREEQYALRLAYWKERFPQIENVQISGTKVLVNNIGILSCNWDKWRNADFEFTGFFPVDVLRIVATMFLEEIEEKLPEHGYKYRAVQTLLIRYFDCYCVHLSPTEMVKLVELSYGLPCERNDRNRNGFYAWLLTRSYCCTDGGQLETFEYRRKLGTAKIAEFRKLWSETHPS